MNKDTIAIDKLRNEFLNEVEGIELFSMQAGNVWEFRFIDTPFFFNIRSFNFKRIIIFNDKTGEKWTVEEALSSDNVYESVKKIIMYNIELFSFIMASNQLGWAVYENIGIGVLNPKGVTHGSIKKD